MTAMTQTPDVFAPSCQVSFTVYLRNAGYQNSFGWYNANGIAPALEDLHQILDCDEPVNTSKMIDIRSDPDYEGGEIGFFEAVGGGEQNLLVLADAQEPGVGGDPD